MSGLFYTFNIAKRGMAAQQTSLHVTSHNVSNIGTEGYSRQRAVHKTTQPYPMPSLNNAVGPGQLGSGVEVSNITRARDEFIDTSIRREKTSYANYAARNQFLNSIEAVINEPGDTGLSNTLNKFWDSWQALSMNPENATTRKLVISNSQALADSFKQTYTQLEELEKDLNQLQGEKIFEVNSILKQIATLNDQIKQVTINNQTPNDLMDRRDALLDNLSEHINFKVEKGDFNTIRILTKSSGGDERYLLTDGRVINSMASINDVSFTYEKDGVDIKADKSDFPLNIKDISYPMKFTFKVHVDGDVNRPVNQEVEIKTKEDLEKYFNIKSEKIKDASGNEIGSITTIDSIKNTTLLYNKGTDIQTAIRDSVSFDFANGAIKGLDEQKKEICDYKNQLNNIARTIAIAVNTIHSNNGKEIEFFDSTVEGSNHPAKSLKVNQEIVDDPSKIIAGVKLNTLDNEGKTTDKPAAGDNSRAKRIAEIRNMRLDISGVKSREDFMKQVFEKEISEDDLAKGTLKSNNSGDTIEAYYKGMIAQLGVSGQEASRVVENQQNLILQLDIQRQSISGVNLDEEMIDMLQFQRAYQANSKMINVIDELLNVVVNGLIK